MVFEEFVTDMACESASFSGFGDLTKQNSLSHGIVERSLNISDLDLSHKIGRAVGRYITYDCPEKLFLSNSGRRALSGYLAKAISAVAGRLKKSSPVLVIGLGNGDIDADALGEETVRGIEVTREDKRDVGKQSVCAFCTGVLGTTGMQSGEIASAIAQKVKPSFAIVIDSLATSAVSRVGTSFQLTSAGIAPGSGVGQDKERIDKSVLKAPTLAIGVPLMLSLGTALRGFIGDYLSEESCRIDEYKLREMMSARRLSRLIVAPKDIKFMVSYSAQIISDAINEAFR